MGDGANVHDDRCGERYGVDIDWGATKDLSVVGRRRSSVGRRWVTPVAIADESVGVGVGVVTPIDDDDDDDDDDDGRRPR